MIRREVKNRIERLQVRKNVDSDHHSLVIWIKGKGGKKSEGMPDKNKNK